MRIKKSHLKELIRQAIKELKFKSQDDFEKYDKKHNMRPDTKVNIAGKDTTVGQAVDVGGPAHPNVKKKEKMVRNAAGDLVPANTVAGHPDFKKDDKPHPGERDPSVRASREKPKGDEPKKEPSKPKIVAPMDNPFDKKDDEEISGMGAAEKPNKKMEIDVLNKDAEAGDGAQIDTEYGTVTWTSGDPDEDSFIATNEDGEEVEVDYSDIVRFHNDNDSIMKNLNMESIKKSVVLEKFGRRFTVKEVRMWMKTLEENRYKKTYNSDCRRVAWLVNHIGEDIQTMPKSMAKKWSKAAYGRERYLAKEFLKSQKQTMAEHRLRKLIKKVIISEINQIRGGNEKKKKL